MATTTTIFSRTRHDKDTPMARAVAAGRNRRTIRRDPSPWDRGTNRRGHLLKRTQGR